MFQRKQSKKPDIGTLIGAGTRINGDVEFTGGLHVDGHISGNVKSEAASGTLLSVSESGRIEGSVTAASVILNGIVRGNIDAPGRVELGARAQVLGNVRYSVLETAVGAQINGKLIHIVPTDVQAGPVGEPSPKDGADL
jgi:cytoskeletal protein CcmA (bactofilin family)